MEKNLAPLMGKYKDLADALRAAVRAGAAAYAANPEDGGTCNFDSPSLKLPRWERAKVEQAAKAAGLGCFVWNLCGSKRYVFCPRINAQGNAHTRYSEAMTRSLKSAGYDATMYYQMD